MAPAAPPPPPPSPAPVPPAPALVGLLHTLSQRATTFCMFPCPVTIPKQGAYSGLAAKDTGRLQGGEVDAVLLGAVATCSGSVDIITLHRGLLNPLQLEVSASLAVHKDAVRGVRWLGASPRVVSFSSERAAHGWRNTLLVTDIRSRRSLPFRTVAGEAAQVVGIRASPSGSYLLVLLKGAPSELWAVGRGMRPYRVRLIDLPFTAVEWVLPHDYLQAAASPPDLVRWDRSPGPQDTVPPGLSPGPATPPVPSPHSASGVTTPMRPSSGSGDLGRSSLSPAAFGSISAALTAESIKQDLERLPEEFLAFTLGDGRGGVLSVKGRKVADTKARRPPAGLLGPLELTATAMVALGSLVVMGDADGQLIVWDTLTGQTSLASTGLGTVRRITIAPAAPPEAGPPPPGVPEAKAQLSVLFGSGAFGVFHLDATGRIWQEASAAPPATAHLGRAQDLSWLLLPSALGCGPILGMVTEDGALALLSVGRPTEGQAAAGKRLRTMKRLLSRPLGVGGSGGTTCLAPPKAIGSCLLMRRPWALLLRLLLQLGVSKEALLCLTSPSDAVDTDDLRRDLAHLLPPAARHILRHLEATAAADAAGRPDSPATPHSIPGGSHDLISLGTESAGESDTAGASARAGSPSSPGPSGRPPAAPTAAVGRGSGGGGKQLRDAMKALSKVRVFQVGAGSDAGSTAGDSPAARDGAGAGNSGAGGEAYQVTFDGDLVALMRAAAKQRAHGQLLHPPEWATYTQALQSGSTAERMAVAARVEGDQQEALFWQHLPATLAAVRRLQRRMQQQQARQRAAAGRAAASDAGAGTSGQQLEGGLEQGAVSPGRQQPDLAAGGGASSAAADVGSGEEADASVGPLLWDVGAVLAEAGERTRWHEAMSRMLFDSDTLQERRVLEYTVLGDFQTAVAFLLASEPDKSARYYRDALCTLALAASSSARQLQQQQGDGAGQGAPFSLLHTQAAKVVAAHAASIGDQLLGVPLHCSAGLYLEAATLLQEVGLWRYAANLAASCMPVGLDRAQVLQRWAADVLARQASHWRSVGILTTAGCLQAALQLLRDTGLPDCAAAYLACCREAGLIAEAVDPAASSSEATSAGGDTQERPSSADADTGGPLQPEATAADDKVGSGDASGAQKREELFDVLASGGVPDWGARRARAQGLDRSVEAQEGALGGGALSKLGLVEAEFDRYVVRLLQYL